MADEAKLEAWNRWAGRVPSPRIMEHQSSLYAGYDAGVAHERAVTEVFRRTVRHLERGAPVTELVIPPVSDMVPRQRFDDVRARYERLLAAVRKLLVHENALKPGDLPPLFAEAFEALAAAVAEIDDAAE